MFLKEKRYLVLTNAITFLILFSILGVVLFQYTKAQVLRDIDKALTDVKRIPEKVNIGIGTDSNNKDKDKENIIMEVNEKTFRKGIPKEPNTTMLIWSKEGTLIEAPIHDFYKDITSYLKYNKLNEIDNISYENFYFRYVAVEISLNNEKVIVQVVKNISPQVEFLETLKRILIFGGLFIFVVSILVAFYLANRALIPIVKAWEKQQLFVSDASHELRTPLTIIQSKLELILKSPEKKVKEVGENIAIPLSETRRLSKLVKNLLTLAKADSNVIELEKTSFCLTQTIANICETYREIAEFGDKRFDEDLEQEVNITADEDRITQLIIILLDNALKYTNEGDSLKVILKKKNNKVLIGVEDSGIGINKKDLPHLFDRFYRGDKSRGREGGHGLGLSIAKWIVDKHSGHIDINSEEGKGTKISVTLPLVSKEKIKH